MTTGGGPVGAWRPLGTPRLATKENVPRLARHDGAVAREAILDVAATLYERQKLERLFRYMPYRAFLIDVDALRKDPAGRC